jgi:hypothetical protein
MERRRLATGVLMDLSEHLRCRGLVEADPVVGAADDADRLEHAQHTRATHIGCELGLAERQLDEADRSEVVDLVGLDLLDGGDQRGQVGEVAVDQLDLGNLVLGRSLPFGLFWPRIIPWYLVALADEQFG